MKKIIILLLVVLFSGSLCFILDKELFVYGKNEIKFYHSLPLNIIPKNRNPHENGFALMDKYGFTIAAKGNSYKFNNKDIVVESVLGYYYKKDTVIAKISTINIEKYFVMFTKNKRSETKQEIAVNVFKSDNNLNVFNCTYVFIGKNNSDRIILLRDSMFLVFIMTIIMCVIQIWRWVNNRQ